MISIKRVDGPFIKRYNYLLEVGETSVDILGLDLHLLTRLVFENSLRPGEINQVQLTVSNCLGLEILRFNSYGEDAVGP